MSELEDKKIKYYPILDLVRFIAALFIILIHIFPEGSTTESVGFDSSIPTLLGISSVYALLRVATPIFFVISGFLLFKKIGLNPEKKWRYIGFFSLKLLFLYLFWYVVALPITIRDITGFINQGDTYNLVRYIVITLWKGAPRGFWFLVSLALSVLIVSLCKSKKSFIAIIIVSSLMYAYGCFNSAYFGIFASGDNPVAKALFIAGDYLELVFSPLEALLFVVLGKIFAQYGSYKIKGNVVFIILSYFLMAGELFLTMYLKVFVYPDAYFFLPVFVFLFMNKIFSIEIENEKFSLVTKKLKKIGSFSYLFHIQFFYYLHWILDATGHNIFRENYILLIIPFVICVLLSFGLQTLFEYLSKYRYLKFLRYSY